MRIAICTPYHADVTAEYARSLGKMLMYTVQANVFFNGAATVPELEVFHRRSSELPRSRNTLAKDALDWGANYLLWIDADHLFPEDALLRLLSLNLPVVGANYPRRQRPTWPTAVGLDGEYVWTTEEAAKRAQVDQVSHLGLGFCLIDINVIRTLYGDGSKPLFATQPLGDGRESVGEDVFFFRRVQEAGFGVFLDHTLSWVIGHVHVHILTNADAMAQMDAGLAAAP